MFQGIIIFNIIATCFWAFQIVFAFLFFHKTKSWRKKTIKHIPKLSVIVPAYNETNYIVQKVVNSIAIQQNVEVEIFLIDDGSVCPVQVQSHPKLTFLRLEKNQGKRAAQIHAIQQASHDWIVTVDSDTVLEPDALYELYKAAVANKWDAVSGHVKLLNEKENLLTRMTACLYWYGFCQERASQGYFGQVTCCSGALALWKKDTILETANLYLNQQYRGKKCVAGDDRYLTCLFAINKKKIGCAMKAVAYTVSPSSFGGFLRQQLRWTRSNTPAYMFTLWNWRKISLLFNLFMFGVFFRYAYFSLLYAFSILTLTFGFYAAPLYILLTILVVSSLKATNAFFYTREWKMFYLMPLAILSFFMLSPVVLYGVFTPSHTDWMTRTKKGGVLKKI